MERCKHGFIGCSECHTAGGDALPMYETGTEQEVLREMAKKAIDAIKIKRQQLYIMREQHKYLSAQIRDFKKLGGIE